MQDSLIVSPYFLGVPVLEFGDIKVDSNGGFTPGFLVRILITCQAGHTWAYILRSAMGFRFGTIWIY